MSSVLIAVGCNRYDHGTPLDYAEADAGALFEILTGPGQPYSRTDSRLLPSPTLALLRETIRELADLDAPETLTLYFSGHGIWDKGSFYCALKDTRADRLATTAFALSEWIRTVKDITPAEVYIVIDACNAAGSQSSATEVLNDPAASTALAASFTCLSASSADQTAKEIDGHGVMTAALIKVLSGQHPTHSPRGHLDLMEVAREVSAMVHPSGNVQKVTAWGLNFHGRGKFCRNPTQVAGDAGLPPVSSESPLRKLAGENFEEIWELYRQIPKGIELPVLRERMECVCSRNDITPEDRSAFVLGVANSFCERMSQFGSKWDVAELTGAFALLLLPDVVSSPTAFSTAKELMSRKAELECAAVSELLVEIRTTPHCLLDTNSHMADYYFLPQRISKLLAVIANASFIAREQGRHHFVATGRELVSSILDTYAATLKSVSDSQASSVFVWFQRTPSIVRCSTALRGSGHRRYRTWSGYPSCGGS